MVATQKENAQSAASAAVFLDPSVHDRCVTSSRLESTSPGAAAKASVVQAPVRAAAGALGRVVQGVQAAVSGAAGLVTPGSRGCSVDAAMLAALVLPESAG